MQAAQRDRERCAESPGQTGTCSGDTDGQVINWNTRLNSLITLALTLAYMSAVIQIIVKVSHCSSGKKIIATDTAAPPQNKVEGQPLSRRSQTIPLNINSNGHCSP